MKELECEILYGILYSGKRETFNLIQPVVWEALPNRSLFSLKLSKHALEYKRGKKHLTDSLASCQLIGIFNPTLI
jgi:hypothetical protein